MLMEIAALRHALEHAADSFDRLRSVVPLRTAEGRVRVARTKYYAEAEVLFGGERCLLFAPLDEYAVEAVEQTAAKLRYIDSDCLCRYEIYYSDLVCDDSFGRRRRCDVILQRLPEGVLLADAVAEHSCAQLCAMAEAMHAEFERIGFTHNNLHARNIVVGRDGRMHPLRYHYARLGEGCGDDFAPVYEFIRNNTYK